jgi:hypothetical protein
MRLPKLAHIDADFPDPRVPQVPALPALIFPCGGGLADDGIGICWYYGDLTTGGLWLFDFGDDASS